MNKYATAVMPWTGSDCLGVTHCFGISTGLSENSPDAIKAAHAFSLSSVVAANDDDENENDENESEMVSCMICQSN